MNLALRKPLIPPITGILGGYLTAPYGHDYITTGRWLQQALHGLPPHAVHLTLNNRLVLGML